MKKLYLLLAAISIAVAAAMRDPYTVCVAECEAQRSLNESYCFWGTLPWEQYQYDLCMNGALVIYNQCIEDCNEKHGISE